MRSKKGLLILLIAILFSAVFFAGCNQAQETTADYFPFKAGTEWTYKVDMPITFIQPLHYYVIIGNYSQGQGPKYPAYMVIFSPLSLSMDHPDCCRIQIKIEEVIISKSGKTYLAALNIIKDEMNFHDAERAKEIDWAIVTNNEFTVNQFTVYPGYVHGSSSSPDMLSAEMIFFDPKSLPEPGSVGYSQKNRLRFVGYENNISGYEGISCMHFMRTVEGEYEHYTEDTWFAKGKGLVRLEQKQDGLVSMVWTLESFKGA